MVWLTEKKILHHVLDLGYERVKIPVRVKFEFEIKEGAYVSQSLATHTLRRSKGTLLKIDTFLNFRRVGPNLPLDN